MSERRATIFPGSSNINLPKKRSIADVSESSSTLSAPKTLRTTEFLKEPLRALPPALPVKASSDSNQYRHRLERLPTSPKPRSSIEKGNPWESYRAILRQSHDGTLTLAHEINSKHEIVAIREQNCRDIDVVKRLVVRQHANLVTLYKTFLHRDRLYFVYEPMDVSLAEIQSTSHGAFEAYQIAAICTEEGSSPVLRGLQFVHEMLKIAHGNINAETILLNRSGRVKIAHIGPAVVQGTPANQQKDVQSLGFLMFGLMELGTSLIEPHSLKLEHPDLWDVATKTFLAKMEHSSVEDLLKDDFLKKSPGTDCFKALVLITEMSISREWEDLMTV